MDFLLVADTVAIATRQTLGLAKSLLLHRQNCINPADQSAQISAAIIDALAPPPVKSRTARRTLLRKRRRTRRRSQTGGDGNSEGCGEEYGFFGGGDGDGPFGGGGGSWGGGGGDGGRGWNFDKFGEQNWDESSWWFSSWSSDFAYGFVYEVIYWIALSNCVHFAFKKVVRIVADGFADTDREKVPMRLASIY